MFSIISYLFIINVVTFFIYSLDRHFAVYGKTRVPDAVLFGLAFIGAAFGALMGMLYFHHKKGEKLFEVGVPILLFVQVVFFLILAYVLRIFPTIF